MDGQVSEVVNTKGLTTIAPIAPAAESRLEPQPRQAPAASVLRPEVAFQQVVARMGNAAVEEMRARYSLGQLVHGLRYNPSRSGTLPNLVRFAAAREFRLGAATLRRLARVSEAIGPMEFDRLMQLRCVDGLPLTWSHVEELAEVRSAEQRRRYAEFAVSRMLPVRALRSCIRAQTLEAK
jgi:hypothetical protein